MGERDATAAHEPAATYRERLRARQYDSERLARRFDAIAHARVAMALGAVLVGALAWWAHRLNPWWIALPLTGFVLLVLLHEGVVRRRARADRAAAFYERALARIEHRWMGHGEAGEAFRDPEHPYAEHLDLFGKGSLFELLCTAQTTSGRQTLAAWLLQRADRGTVRRRHEAILEMRPLLDLREELALAGTSAHDAIAPEALVAWGQLPPLPRLTMLRIACALLAVLTVAAAVVWALTPIGPLPLLLAVLAEFLAVGALRRRVERIVAVATHAADALSVLAAVVGCLEKAPLKGELLRKLQGELVGQDASAAHQIRRLRQRFELLESARNQFFAPLAALLLWRTQVAFSIEQWRIRWGGRIAAWLSSLGSLEALCALAGYSYEHPSHCFPTLTDAGPCFRSRALGHPLLSPTACVRNDLVLGPGRRLLVVSGSNMSGKSTLLRAVGVNAVLALMGAPVCAEALALSPLAVGASLQVHDSLLDGASRFFAEIKQLRRIVELTRSDVAALFLVDEILHGTNSMDRRIGAKAVLEGLVQRGAIGLVTTHDLALASIAQGLPGEAANVHFEERLDGDRMVFDYELREGVARSSNALALMRAMRLID